MASRDAPALPGRQPAPRPDGPFKDRQYQNSTSVVARLRAQQQADAKRFSKGGSDDEDGHDYEQAMDDSLPAIRGPQGRLIAPENDTDVIIRPLVQCSDGVQRPLSMHGDSPDLAPNWFRGQMSRQEADAILRRNPKGSFLIRTSARQPNEYVLSCRECYPKNLCPHEIAHFPIKIDNSGGQQMFILPPLTRKFTSLENVVEQLCRGIDDLALKLGRAAR